MAGPVHYELYIRKTAPAPWVLQMATEERRVAVEMAEELLSEGHAAAVRVTKETLDTETMEFNSVTLLTKGAPEQVRKRLITDEHRGPRCLAPQDLYEPLARDLIGRVLEDWLKRQGVTPFELLHRPDLAERLEASGLELQHAIQKVAVPESQSVGQPVHELVRHYQKLVERALERIVSAGRRGGFPDLEDRSVADLAHRLTGKADRGFVMGGAVAGALKGLRGGRARLDRLMDIADGAPMDGPPRALVLVPIEQILCELMAARTGLGDVLGSALDQGASLAAVVRMVAPAEVAGLIAQDPRLQLQIPAVTGPAARLGERIQAGEFPLLASSLARMVVRELMSPRRLRPGDAVGEIDIMRTLATALTATAGRLLTMEEVQTAFIERSKSIVTADFVAAYVGGCDTVLGEAQALTRLCENVTGGGNKRSAARWLSACVGSLRFETEMRQGVEGRSPAQTLGVLAGLQGQVGGAALSERDRTEIIDAIGAVGSSVEAEARLTGLLARAKAPLHQRLAALLRMAAGETAPSGPAADRAKAEAIKLLRQPETRVALSQTPADLASIRTLMQAAGLAA